jgi:hypothetical protein
MTTQRSIILGIVGVAITAQPFFAQNIIQDTQTGDLHPFTHFVSIPADSDPATIKFEKVKTTKVFTKVKSTSNPGYCKDLQFRDPGGSMYCPHIQEESPEPAYEVTYSYSGQPLTSDEYGNRYFTFQVYFRPEELPPALQRAISGKMKRDELATYFNVATSRPPVRTAVIDQANSKFCDGNYVDGFWVQNDPNCRDKVTSKLVTAPSEYITVQVDPVSPRTQQTVAER